MAETKIGILIINLLGGASFFWALIETWGDVKSLILFVMALVFGFYKIISGHIDYEQKKFDFREHKKEVKEKWEDRKIEKEQIRKNAQKTG